MKDEIGIADSNTDEWKEWAKEDWEYVDGEYIEIIATPAGITARTSSKGCRVMEALVNWEINAPWADVLKHVPAEALIAALKQIAYDRGGDEIIFVPLLTEEQREEPIDRQWLEDAVRLGLGPHLHVPCGFMPRDPDPKDKEEK